MDEPLFAESRKELDEKERAAGWPLGHLQQVAIRFRPQDVGRHLRDPGLVHRTECDLGRSVTRQEVNGAPNLGGSRPGRRAITQPIGTVASRDGNARSRPPSRCRPTERHRGRPARAPERRPLKQRFEILQQPISLLGRSVRVAQGRAVKDRGTTLEQGLHQHRQLDDRVARVSHTAADPYRQASRHRRHLPEKAALTHPGAPLHQDDRTETGKKLVEVLTQDRQLRVAATDGLDGSTLRRSKPSVCL